LTAYAQRLTRGQDGDGGKPKRLALRMLVLLARPEPLRSEPLRAGPQAQLAAEGGLAARPAATGYALPDLARPRPAILPALRSAGVARPVSFVAAWAGLATGGGWLLAVVLTIRGALTLRPFWSNSAFSDAALYLLGRPVSACAFTDWTISAGIRPLFVWLACALSASRLRAAADSNPA